MDRSIKALPLFWVVTTLLAFCIMGCATKQSEPEVQERQPILDFAHLLTASQRDSISNVIKNLEQSVGAQIAVLIVDSLGDESIEKFSLARAQELKLGRAAYDDGILLTIAMRDRQSRIEVGTGLENIIKDDIAAQILREEMSPHFRNENYGRGIYVGVSKLSTLIEANKDLVGTTPK
jgi:uncharacterized membrane protein YgcG